MLFSFLNTTVSFKHEDICIFTAFNSSFLLAFLRLCLFSLSHSPVHFDTEPVLMCVCMQPVTCDDSDHTFSLKQEGRLTVYRSEGLWLPCDRFNFYRPIRQKSVIFGAPQVTALQERVTRLWSGFSCY